MKRLLIMFTVSIFVSPLMCFYFCFLWPFLPSFFTKKKMINFMCNCERSFINVKTLWWLKYSPFFPVYAILEIVCTNKWENKKTEYMSDSYRHNDSFHNISFLLPILRQQLSSLRNYSPWSIRGDCVVYIWFQIKKNKTRLALFIILFLIEDFFSRSLVRRSRLCSNALWCFW